MRLHLRIELLLFRGEFSEQLRLRLAALGQFLFQLRPASNQFRRLLFGTRVAAGLSRQRRAQ